MAARGAGPELDAKVVDRNVQLPTSVRGLALLLVELREPLLGVGLAHACA